MFQSLLQLRRHLRLQHLLLRSRRLQRHLSLLRLKRLLSLRQPPWLLRLPLSPLHHPFRLPLHQHRPPFLRLPRSHLRPLRNKRKRFLGPDRFRPLRMASHCDRLLKMLLLSVQRFPGNNGPASLALKGPQQLLRRVPARSRSVLCLPAIVVPFQPGTAARCPPAIVVRFLPAIGRAARVPVSLCVRSRVAKVVLILLAPADKVAPAVRKIVLRTDSVQA